MDLDHWKQLDSLLQSVLERPPEERDAFSPRACTVMSHWNASPRTAECGTRREALPGTPCYRRGRTIAGPRPNRQRHQIALTP